MRRRSAKAGRLSLPNFPSGVSRTGRVRFMIYLQKNPTAAYGLYRFNNNQSQGTNFLTYKLAGFMILMIPTFIIFLVFKDKFMASVTEGGMKG